MWKIESGKSENYVLNLVPDTDAPVSRTGPTNCRTGRNEAYYRPSETYYFNLLSLVVLC
eukprot:SAG31_NODE_322_length_17726_cov_18.070006_17_plen_59_part_00